MTRAAWDDADSRWVLDTESGARWSARFVVLATGQLSITKMPELPGQERFAGVVHHTARWPERGVDLTGLRVGIIGTGSSGMQMIPDRRAGGRVPRGLPAHSELQRAGGQRADQR